MKRVTCASPLVSSMTKFCSDPDRIRPAASVTSAVSASSCAAETRSFSSSSSRSKCSPRVRSSTCTMSINLRRWLMICVMTASVPVVTSVRRDTVGSSVGATDRELML